ncbi:MAG: hypothetical protein HWD59_08245 [Coxiellaceae bacterium]|nr:MAG: hypothetical protein HWD59_08245 [Coxiellaceae bacterium]
MNLHPKTLIEDWLEELDAFNKCWLGNPKTSTPGIFTQEEVVHWANQTNYQFCFIPAAFSYGTITISYQLFLELRALFFDTNQSPEKLVAPETWPSNHQALVGEIYPAIIPHYEKARLSANTPEGRFNALPTDYEKVIDPDCSVPVSKSKKQAIKIISNNLSPAWTPKSEKTCVPP